MKVELFPFQHKALRDLRTKVAKALGDYHTEHTPQVVSYTAPTGAGKTIIMASLIESIYHGYENYPDQTDAIFVWLSDSPELNEQSKMKIDLKADRILPAQTVTIDDSSFDRETLEDGKIYFLNTQKLSVSSNLTKHSDSRQHTIWETIRNTAREKSDRLYFIIDEAHRGMQGNKAAAATTIMQKFLKGSVSEGLEPLPVVIGITATPERFNKLVSGLGTTTIRKVVTTADEVRSSGLLKDRIIINYPDTLNNEMAVLQAATDEWMDKVRHWDQYCREQHYAYVRPALVIQVLNGSGGKISDTDLDVCLQTIEQRSGLHFSEGEVVHTFGQTTSDIMVGGLKVRYIEPSRIADDRLARVVFFKENLSTGWDCPRAETMMSFRHANDSTYIAQLLGRMVRTPMQMHIQVDESLNDVHLFLPYFNADTVKTVVEELQASEGGNIADVLGESLADKKVDTLSVKPLIKPVIPARILDTLGGTPAAKPDDKPASFDFDSAFAPLPQSGEAQQENTTNSVDGYTPLKPAGHSLHDESDKLCQNDPATPDILSETASPAAAAEAKEPQLDRFAVLTAINDLGLLSYDVRKVIIKDYLHSMFDLSRLLVQSGIDTGASDAIKTDITGFIRAYIDTLKAAGKYEDLVTKVRQFKLKSQVFDVFGSAMEGSTAPDLFSSTDADIDRQFNLADITLGREGIGNAYGNIWYDDDNPLAYKVDVILYASDETCKAALYAYAKKKYHSLVDASRMKTISLSEKLRKKYDSIVSNGDIISKHNFRLPETISSIHDKDGRVFTNHLYVDWSGKATIKLNAWEIGTLEEEFAKPGFVCWIRNTPRASWALSIPYGKESDKKPAYPDFLVVHKDSDDTLVVDILEPHDPTREDNLPKAKGFAWYASQNPGLRSIQLIRVAKDITGTSRFRRLDLSKSLVREKVMMASTNEELDNIFLTDGYSD